MTVVHVFVGGEPVSPERIGRLAPADLVIAADSGADLAAAAGVTVDVLVGDLDSISRETLERVFDDRTAIESHPPGKDATDLELAMEVAVRSDPTEIVFVGGGGGRLDHLLGNVAVIAGPAARNASVTWVTEGETAFVVRGSMSIPTSPGTTFSLIPIGGDAHGVDVRKARWQLRDASLGAHRSVGISNVAVAGEVDIAVGQGVLLAVFNRIE